MIFFRIAVFRLKWINYGFPLQKEFVSQLANNQQTKSLPGAADAGFFLQVCFVGRKRRDEVYDLARKRLQSRLEREKGTFVPRPKEITVSVSREIVKKSL